MSRQAWAYELPREPRRKVDWAKVANAALVAAVMAATNIIFGYAVLMWWTGH